MSYGEPEAILIIFSADRSGLQNVVDGIRKELERKGSEYQGPINHERVKHGKLRQFLRHIDDPDSDRTAGAENLPDWLFDAVKSDEHVDALLDAAESKNGVSGHEIRIVGNDSIGSILSRIDVPQGICVAAVIGPKRYGKGSGNDPYTYNPNVEHVTEM